MTNHAISVAKVTKVYEQWQRSGQVGDIWRNLLKPEKRTITALSDISFTIERGEFVAYAGPNGAGKSTTMKLLAGMLRPNKGEISVLGLSPQNQRVPLMRRVGVLFGNRSELWWDHPISSSFEWKKVVWGIEEERFRRTRDLVVDMLDIGDLMRTFARELSLGQRMRADLALMLLHDPELILLDEPTLGLDVVAKRQMIEFLKELNRLNGTTVVVTSHDMDDLEEMAQRIMLIAGGRIAFDGSFARLRQHTGNVCRITLNVDGGVPELSLGRLISSEHGLYEYEINTAQTPMQQVLGEVATMNGITDIEIRRAPIEQIIAGLYTAWKNGDSSAS